MSMEASLATWELTKDQVSSPEKLLLLSLARRAGEDHTCWPSVKRMVEDTGLDRKYVISNRQKLIDKKLIKYTGRMVGRSGQIPEMKLLYVDAWEQKRNSPRLKDNDEPVDNSAKSTMTSTQSGTGTSTQSGTGTSTQSGTLNSKEEYKNRNKSFCNLSVKKNEHKFNKPNESKSTVKDWGYENDKRHDFADSKDRMASERKHIDEHEKIKKIERAPMPPDLKEFISNLRNDNETHTSMA